MIRGQRVVLDADLARLYGVPTYRFNEALKRNRDRFLNDFAFQLTAEEFANLRSQIATSSLQGTDKAGDKANSSQIARSSSSLTGLQNWSQFATSSSRHRGEAYRPWAFTEHGALMAANVLRSERAVRMSVFVVRAFVPQTPSSLAASIGSVPATHRIRAGRPMITLKDYQQRALDSLREFFRLTARSRRPSCGLVG